jgi:hypothetical protein
MNWSKAFEIRASSDTLKLFHRVLDATIGPGIAERFNQCVAATGCDHPR